MPRPPARVMAGAATLVGATLLPYLPVLNAGYIWDDDVYLTQNPTLRTPEGLKRIWTDLHANPQYYPLVFTSFWIEHQLWGLNPAGYHLVNVLLHAASAVLVWRVLNGLGIPGSWAAAAIFALHPVHVESVAWITERKNTLSVLLYLTSLIVFIRFARLDAEADPPRASWRLYALSLVMFVGALLSKTVTCSLPAAILLIYWWRRRTVRMMDGLALAPFFLIGLVMGLLTSSIEREHVGAEGADWSLSIIERCLVAGRALCFYLGKLVWPARLTFIYPRWHVDETAWDQYLFPLVVVCTLGALWAQRGRIGRGPLTAMLFFAGTLLPALGFFNVYPMRYSFVADHFQYLASLGPITLFTALLTRALQPRGKPSKPAVTRARKRSEIDPAAQRGLPVGQSVLAALLLCVLGVLTWRQGHIYKDAETLWRDTLAKNRFAWLAHTNLANILIRRGSPQAVPDAETHYAEALRLNPNFAQAHVGMGTVQAKLGRVEKAIEHFESAVRLKPDLAEAQSNLGLAHLQGGDVEQAMPYLEQAVRLSPDNGLLHRNLALGLKSRGDIESAIRAMRDALARLRVGQPQLRFELGELLKQQGRLEEAAVEYRTALESDPNHNRARQALMGLAPSGK